MTIETCPDPTQEQGRAFFTRGISGSIVMLNLLRFRSIADCAAAPESAPASPLSGEEAYQLYMKRTLPPGKWLQLAGGRCAQPAGAILERLAS